ncbi:MAG: hypothetical protein SF187_23660 [Deltaproteobacteria bacterium]|nr:hypothetical protein [Deltaproteobacteria bacterium]
MAKDIAQRELDQAGFRIGNLGNPIAAGDATKTDNQSVPKANAGNGSAGTSFLAAAADHVHPAGGDAGGADGCGFIDVSDPSCQAVKGKTEEIVAEFNVDFGGLKSPQMLVSFCAIAKAAGGTATLKVRLGGTVGLPDGNVIATATTNGGTFSPVQGQQPADNPGQPSLVKITAVTDSDGGEAFLYGKTVEFRKAAA